MIPSGETFVAGLRFLGAVDFEEIRLRFAERPLG